MLIVPKFLKCPTLKSKIFQLKTQVSPFLWWSKVLKNKHLTGQYLYIYLVFTQVLFHNIFLHLQVTPFARYIQHNTLALVKNNINEVRSTLNSVGSSTINENTYDIILLYDRCRSLRTPIWHSTQAYKCYKTMYNNNIVLFPVNRLTTRKEHNTNIYFISIVNVQMFDGNVRT